MFFFFFFFFFFFDSNFYPGQVCEFVINDPRNFTMPKLFPDRIGDRVVIEKVMSDHIWAYDDKPIKYRLNKNGRQVVEFDPRGVTSPYSFDELRIIEAKPISRREW